MTLDPQRRLKPVGYRYRLVRVIIPAVPVAVLAWVVGVEFALLEAVVLWAVLAVGLVPAAFASVLLTDALVATSGGPVPEDVPEGRRANQGAV